MNKPPIPNPGVRIPPPLLFLGGLAVAAILDRLRPLRLHDGAPFYDLIGYILIVLGFGLMIWAIFTFSRAGTDVLPTRAASTLVLTGPYRWTRNPMYVGFTILYLGGTLLLASVWPLILLPFVIGILIVKVIRREERYLDSAFGAEYGAYRRRVRRWI